MNNMKYYPFDRNSYYTGKVWSAGDFESEQRYMNDKRRLQNRFVMGMGVVCGLDVVSLDDGQISVEKGFALDGSGREIILADADVKKLSAIDGYLRGRDDIVYYLYLAYRENGTQQSSEDVSAKNTMKDKIHEGYALYLSEKKPVFDMGDVRYYYYNVQTVFEQESVRIVSILPKYIQAGEKFIYKLEIDAGDADKQIQLQMRVDLECVRYQGKDKIEIEFDSRRQRDKNGVYVLEYICESMFIVDDMADFKILPEHVQLEVDGKSCELKDIFDVQAVMTDEPVERCVMGDYQTCLMNYIEHNPAMDVCIAEITLKDGKISRIGKDGRIQNVLANDSLALTHDILKEKISILERENDSVLPSLYEYEDKTSDYEIATGEVVINLGIGGDAGQRFFSEEITHGLGLGNVTVILGRKDHADKDGSFIFGSSEIFDVESTDLKAELAAKVNPLKGTFRIGARLLEFTSAYEMVISWMAIQVKDRRSYETDRKMIIDNSLKSLHVMESAYYSVKFVNMAKMDVRWSVEGQNAGTINESGCYTAPDHPGVFQIKAVCINEPQVQASAFIVVKP